MPWHAATFPPSPQQPPNVVLLCDMKWQSGNLRDIVDGDSCCILIYFVVPFYANWGQQRQQKQNNNSKKREEEKVNKKKRKKNKQSERHAMRALCLLLLLLFDKKFSFVLCRDKNCDSWLWLECDNNYNTLLQLFYCQITNVFVYHIIFSTYV